jgi:hypothetical protein
VQNTVQQPEKYQPPAQPVPADLNKNTFEKKPLPPVPAVDNRPEPSGTVSRDGFDSNTNRPDEKTEKIQ